MVQEGQQALLRTPPAFAPFAKASAPLLKTKSLLASMYLGDRAHLSVSLFADDAATAREVHNAASGLVRLANENLNTLAKKEPKMAFAVGMGRQALKDLKVGLRDKEITLAYQADVNLLMALIVPAIQKVRQAAGRTQEVNN